MLQNYTDLLPFRNVPESDILQMYSFNGTGIGGRFVTCETGFQDPINTAGNYSSTPVGAAYAGTTSLRYENQRKVRYSLSGESRFQILGLMMHGTVETDSNGQRVILNTWLKDELGVVYSGETTPIAVNGYFRIKSTAYSGQPIAGYAAVPHNTNPGQVAFLPYASVTDKNLIIAKVLSNSGSAFGGYADILLTLT